MILFHGSYMDIDFIDLKRSMKGKDFGQGFYLTSDIRQAQEIAKLRSLATRSMPVVNVYEFDEAHLSNGSLKVKKFDTYDLEWAQFVLSNRSNKSDIPIHDFDIVYGPIANDRVGQQIRKFLDKEINLTTFLENLKYLKGITFQYYFGTQKAISYLCKRPSITS